MFMITGQGTKINDWLHRTILRVATKQAFKIFALRHPRWAASLFDEYFLLGQMEGGWQINELPAPTKLARAWLGQLGPSVAAHYEYRLAEITPVATDFLTCLESELEKYQTLWHIIFRRRPSETELLNFGD